MLTSSEYEAIFLNYDDEIHCNCDYDRENPPCLNKQATDEEISEFLQKKMNLDTGYSTEVLTKSCYALSSNKLCIGHIKKEFDENKHTIKKCLHCNDYLYCEECFNKEYAPSETFNGLALCNKSEKCCNHCMTDTYDHLDNCLLCRVK